ncbi:unnamed protein product, partial [Adineta ricciae]
VSLHQPNLPSSPVWNLNGIIFANESIVGAKPMDVFVDTKNSIYVLSKDKKQIIVWHNNSINPTQNISANFERLSSLFVRSNGDIYFIAGLHIRVLMRWISEKNSFTIITNVSPNCAEIFIDINDRFYCSVTADHQVLRRNMKSSSTNEIVVIGRNELGSDSTQLHSPWGIFVDVNFDLFVADSGNDRIQLFPLGETKGITVAGRQSPHSIIELDYPTGVALDAKKYLFIVDAKNNRIVGEGPCGFRCIIGCDGNSFQFNEPFLNSMSFDSFGNIFHTDSRNNRILKYQLTNISTGLAPVEANHFMGSDFSTPADLALGGTVPVHCVDTTQLCYPAILFMNAPTVIFHRFPK